MKAKILEQKSSMKANEECQNGSNTIEEKVVKNSHGISCYNPNLYPRFINKLRK